MDDKSGFKFSRGQKSQALYLLHWDYMGSQGGSYKIISMRKSGSTFNQGHEIDLSKIDKEIPSMYNRTPHITARAGIIYLLGEKGLWAINGDPAKVCGVKLEEPKNIASDFYPGPIIVTEGY